MLGFEPGTSASLGKHSTPAPSQRSLKDSFVTSKAFKFEPDLGSPFPTFCFSQSCLFWLTDSTQRISKERSQTGARSKLDHCYLLNRSHRWAVLPAQQVAPLSSATGSTGSTVEQCYCIRRYNFALDNPGYWGFESHWAQGTLFFFSHSDFKVRLCFEESKLDPDKERS